MLFTRQLGPKILESISCNNVIKKINTKTSKTIDSEKLERETSEINLKEVNRVAKNRNRSR